MIDATGAQKPMGTETPRVKLMRVALFISGKFSFLRARCHPEESLKPW
jgi:hypothetical protein